MVESALREKLVLGKKCSTRKVVRKLLVFHTALFTSYNKKRILASPVVLCEIYHKKGVA